MLQRAGPTAGRELHLAWQLGTWAWPVAPAPNRRANNAQRNRQTAIVQQRQEQLSRPL